jgi:hypothetical protein
MEQLFKAAAISSTNSGNVPMRAAAVIKVVIAVVINVTEFGMAFSRDAATHFQGLVIPECPGQIP